MKFKLLLQSLQTRTNLSRKGDNAIEIGPAILLPSGSYSSVDITLHKGDISLCGTIVFDLVADEFVLPTARQKVELAVSQMITRIETGVDEVPPAVQALADATGTPAVFEYAPGLFLHVQPRRKTDD